VAVPSGNITANKWNYFVGTYDGSTIRVYVGGIEINSTNDSFTPGYTGATPQLTIGAMYDTGTPGNYYAERYFDGIIDEVRIWNRSLTAAEINQSYMSNLYKYNNASWAFYSNQTNLTTATYNYSGCAKDTAGNENCTETRSLTIQTIAPSINLTYPLNTSYTVNVSWLNYTTSDANLQACWYSLNNGLANTSIACGTNATGLTSSEGNNTWLVSANDSVNNINISRVTFVKDTINPNVSAIHAPVSGGNYSNATVILNASVSDATIGLSAVYFNLSNLYGHSSQDGSGTQP